MKNRWWSFLLTKLRIGDHGSGKAGYYEDGISAYEWKEYAIALRKFSKLAIEGDARAQTNLADMYMLGQGVVKDDAKAVLWYRLAAGQGYAAAQCNLACMYELGTGVPQDYTEAMRLYKLAAEQGDEAAQHKLTILTKPGVIKTAMTNQRSGSSSNHNSSTGGVFSAVTEEKSNNNSIDEYNISHKFDENNEWIGYEFIERVSDKHIRFAEYGSDGEIISIKHVFESSNTEIRKMSVSDFEEYIANTRYIAAMDNLKNFGEDIIDTISSLDTAKYLAKYKSMKRLR